MAEKAQRVVIAATATSPLLPHVLHALCHQSSVEVTLLTRTTSIDLSRTTTPSHAHSDNANHKDHHQSESKFTHKETDFSTSQLYTYLQNTKAVICILAGSDVHLTGQIVDASSNVGVELFIPSEYGLDSSNSRIRDLLPPYQTRFEIQQQLKQSGMNWTAVYAGILLEEGLKADGVLGIDALWGSVVEFPHDKETKVALSTYDDIANCIVDLVMGRGMKTGNGLYTCTFRTTLEDLIDVVEKEIGKKLDRYEGYYEGAKKEAAERMKLGFFDGGVALLGRVAVWNEGVQAWSGWKDQDTEDGEDWKNGIRKVVRMVRNGEIGGGVCGC